MKKLAIVLLFSVLPSVSFASGITPAQANSIIGILVAFHADASVIANVRSILFRSIVVPTAALAPALAPAATIEQPASPVAAPPVVSINPNFGSVMQDQSKITVELVHVVPADVKNNIPFGTFILKTHVLDKDGNYVNGAPISMHAPNNLEGETVDRVIDTTTDLHSKDYYVQFGYVPTQSGTFDLTFTSGGLSTTFPVEVK